MRNETLTSGEGRREAAFSTRNLQLMSLSPREMLARLVAFPSVSSVSNLDIIGFCRDWLASHGV